MQKNNANSQLQWVMLLLVVAVVLPAVCLLWFMNQAVKNERFAIRQKLTDLYTNKAKKIIDETIDSYWQKQIDEFIGLINTAKDDNIEAVLMANPTEFDSVVIIDPNNEICWPTYNIDKPKQQKTELEEAWQVEFVEQYHTKAANLYLDLADSNDIDLSCLATQGQARCLKKAGKLTDAAKIYKKLAWPIDKKTLCNNTIANNRLMLLGLYRSLAHKDFFNQAQKQVTDVTENTFRLDSETQYFYLCALTRICKESGIETRLKGFDRINKIIKADELALKTAQNPASIFSENRQQKTFRKTEAVNDIYGIYNEADDKKIIALIEKEKLSKYFQGIIDNIDDEMVFARLSDNKEKAVAGQKFLSLSPGSLFPDWKIELYFRSEVFSSAANQHQLVYLWMAAIVIFLMLGVASLTAKAILKQARLNRLKNDFIATVTHELKTPLASTRLLVDTLIEGNYQDNKTADEYLCLISKENQRLTHLIDNFLTFSRMERNKQAFDMTATSPMTVAESAADAMRTKFNNSKKCEFAMEIEKNLPDVYADKDAMVTVLVNLLDNAYKYSYDEKQIILRVFKADNQICFEVKDNGLGMSKRQTKKIFDRFYQADNSLARKAEGTGLGLSIVKFIVDAHKGKIEVKSQSDKGSNFIVSLPL